ncbi:MAG: glycoside hydrolase family 127 protein [Lentisphaerae bacterium]|nr:glycoside hydrolase family 127 protein [Lentisphaerota bacterium]
MGMRKFNRPLPGDIRTADPVFAERIKVCIAETIPATMRKTVETGRLDAFKLNWKEGDKNKPHIFWDSDTAKVLEGMAYCLALNPDPELEKNYDEWVELICSAQQEDGYLNTYFTRIESEKRWAYLSWGHELYCAGHLIEAAVAGYECLGKRKLLDCICRYADYIDSVFGLEEGKRRGWPGHEEIELALIKLYRVTGNKRYLKLASYFVNDRGTEPNVFKTEIGEANWDGGQNLQAHRPVREQDSAVGHAVRAVYLYAGMADVADEENDVALLEVCECLFEDIRQHKMYITGGIGSGFAGEKFTIPYDLTNSSLMYAESCATIGLAQFAIRMFNITGNNKYLDVAELALYNGALSGISTRGDTYFYTNYLEVDDNLVTYNSGAKVRQPWFACSCCPTSFARFIPQLGTFLWSAGDNEIAMNIPAACHADLKLKDGRRVSCQVEGDYPYDGKIRITMETAGNYRLLLRIPSWCKQYTVTMNGKTTDSVIQRNWDIGDVVELNLEMPVSVIRSNTKITGNNGRIALKRGPVVYALEQIDQQVPVRETLIDIDGGFRLFRDLPGLPEGTVGITGKAVHEYFQDSNALYTDEPPTREDVPFKAIPYALWQNRGDGNMAIWLRAK